MTIDKPDIGEQDWGNDLNNALDVLDSKETLDGAQTKATQAYTSGTEYTDARLNEITLDLNELTTTATAAAVSASASAASAGAASTTSSSMSAAATISASDAAASASAAADAVAAAQAALTDKQNVASLAKDVATQGFYRSSLTVVGDMGNSLALNGTLSTEGNSWEGVASLSGLSYFAFALPRTNGRFRYGGVAATHGFTTAQILATHLPNVLISDWHYVHMQVLTNDINDIVAGTITIDDTKNNVISMVDQIKAANKTPILCTAPPIGAVVGLGAPALTALTKLNLWIKAYAHAEQIPFVDYHTALVNPANNEYTTGMGNADGVHVVQGGAFAMGTALAALLNSLPGQVRSPLVGSYNPNLMIPDACLTSSTSGEKAVGTGVTTGGWSFKTMAGSPFIKGNADAFARGSAGDYGLAWPTTGSWVAGHRVRLAFALDVPSCPGSGTWNAQLYNYTDLHTICGFSGMTGTLTNRSLAVTDGATTSASNVITCATSKPFRPQHVGCVVASGTGITSVFVAGTTITGVAADGSTATVSANASTTQSSATVIVMGEPTISVWEFTVQPDMVGKDIRFGFGVGGQAGTAAWAAQVSLYDLTALGIA